jgi:hypothetical protein
MGRFLVSCGHFVFLALTTWESAQESFLFDLASRRELVSAQHLLIQGLPVPGLCSDTTSQKFPWPRLVSLHPDPFKGPNELSDSQVKHLGGKSFHQSQIGAFLMFVWSVSLIQEWFCDDFAETIIIDESQDLMSVFEVRDL